MASNIENAYDIDIKINGQKVEIVPNQYSFIMRDNIHNIYPELKFQIKDLTGLLNEYLLFTEGIPIEISYGINGDSIKNNYTILDNDLKELANTRNLSGDTTINGISFFYEKQNVISKSYKGRISDIIKQICNNYSFNQININDTGNDDIWYQPMITDEKFMTEILLPNTYSNNSQKSPFYLFIDNNNNFNLRNYYYLISQKEVEELHFTNENSKFLKQNVILDIQKFITGATVTKPLRNRKLYYHSKEDGTISEENDFIYSYPETNNQVYPIIKNDNITSYEDMYYKEEEDIGKKESMQGRQINSMKNTLFLERYLLTTPLNVKLISGKMIKLVMPSPGDKTNQESSFYLSGNYLIERSDHVWDGLSTKRGYSQIVISRKSINIPSTYLIKSDLFSS